MKVRTLTLQLQVTCPVTVGESEVERVINQALDEPLNDWGNWFVGGVIITGVSKPFEEEAC